MASPAPAARSRHGSPGGVIGPNALIRVAEALTERHGAGAAQALFAAAGLGRQWESPPTAMVDEALVTALHAALRARLGVAEARAVAWRAGELTAVYLLGHRIPRPVQRLLRLLPPQPAARLLMGAIGTHAWTFAGSGRFRYRLGRPLAFSVEGCPLCHGAATTPATPLCDYYAGTFDHLLKALVSRQATVTQTHCAAAGAAACSFAATW